LDIVKIFGDVNQNNLSKSNRELRK